MTQYDLSRNFWDFAFENPDKIKPTHIAMYFFAVEHCNRLGWKEKFGLPSSMAMEATGIKSYNSYKKHFDDLCEWGFFKLVQLSKNQYSSNIIALSKNDKAKVKALDKANAKHTSKQSESTVQSTGESTDSIDKPITINTSKEDINIPTTSSDVKNNVPTDWIKDKREELKNMIQPYIEKYGKDLCNDFWYYWGQPHKKLKQLKYEGEKYFDVNARLRTFKTNANSKK